MVESNPTPFETEVTDQGEPPTVTVVLEGGKVRVLVKDYDTGGSVELHEGYLIRNEAARMRKGKEATGESIANNRDKAVINAMLKQVGGKRVADGNVTATGKVRRRIIRDFLTGSEGRVKFEGWLPNYMAFPFKAYTKNCGVRIEDARNKVKGLIKR